jgi:hypothetical protein
MEKAKRGGGFCPTLTHLAPLTDTVSEKNRPYAWNKGKYSMNSTTYVRLLRKNRNPEKH